MQNLILRIIKWCVIPTRGAKIVINLYTLDTANIEIFTLECNL